MMERSSAVQDRVSREGHGPFAKFVGRTQRATSGPPFFFVCVAIAIAWAASLPAWHDVLHWQAVLHTVTSLLVLLLLVLQENATRRSDETVQEKLNVLAEGLAELMEAQGRAEDGTAAATRLRQAVGLEARH